MIKKAFANPIFRYVFIGGLTYIVDIAVLVGLHSGFHAPRALAASASFWIGLLTSFVLQKLVAFKDYQKELRAITRQAVGYGVLVAFNYSLTVLIVSFFPDRDIIFSRTLAVVITTVWNYTFYKSIFRKNQHSHIQKRIWEILLRMFSLKNRGFNIFLLTLPIIIFNLNLLLSGNKIIPGDPDYSFQLYEAFRRSVLEFHQFPMWNPWIAGGIPLFANVQFGLVSIQAPFALLFGAIIGMKISIVVYEIVGYFGFQKLFREAFNTKPLRATLLAYIPIFGGYFSYRVVAGHFTFLLLAFFPWLALSYINRSKRWGWLWFGLIYSFMVWSSPHYTTIMSAVVIALWFAYETIGYLSQTVRANNWDAFSKRIKQDSIFFFKAGITIAVLTAYRMYFVLNFIRSFPRPESPTNEPYTGVITGLHAIWGINQYTDPARLPSGYGWTEASAYIGIGTLICIIIVLSVCAFELINKRKAPFSYSLVLLVGLVISFFILGMGNFASYSPYHLLSALPVFNNMRVATRWLVWASLFILFIIAAFNNNRFKKTINIVLLLTVVELFVTGSRFVGSAYFLNIQHYRSSTAVFQQEFHYRIPRPVYAHDTSFLEEYPYDENLVETTENNLGQVIAGDSLVDTRQPNSTWRCGQNEGNCPFISSNAKVMYWSPNKIIINRLAPGSINIDINPGRGWRVNGQYTFLQDKVTDPLGPFTINNPSNTITLDLAQKYSPSWISNKLHL
jgi:putative flippase GtrA